MGVRIQVILEPDEKDRLRDRARREGLSLSAWVREAALAYTESSERSRGLREPEALQTFFEVCNGTERDGDEPEWTEHLRSIERSQAQGRADT